MIDHLLILPHLRVQNANAISSPMTWGFPAMSAFIGLIHALERQLPEHVELAFSGVGVVCHDFVPQATPGGPNHLYRPRTFHLTRNPVDKSGSTAAIVEEGRAHLDLTLIVNVEVLDSACVVSHEMRSRTAREIDEIVRGMRIAGGSVMPPLPGQKRHHPELIALDESAEERSRQFRRLKRRLLPGFALVLRDDRLTEHTATLQADNENATALDAWLDLSRLNHECRVEKCKDEDGKEKETVHWEVRRPYPGWLVPIPVGYGAISDLYKPGEVANARDPSVPFQFVESLHSVGEWVSPHRIQKPDDLMWVVENDLERGVYRLVNGYAQTQFDEE
ncbi:type I-F CRISPR-associated protein Csy2 [Halomonas shantousis]